MRKHSWLSVLLVLVLFLTACGGTETPMPEEPAAEEPADTGEVVELRMMWYDDGNEGEVMRDLLDRFEEEHPNIKVVMDTVAYSDLHNVLQAQVEAGTPPDMARVTDMARFAGHYLDMRPYMTDPAGWEENWAEEVLDSFREDKSADGLHGFPTQFTVTGPYINRTLFEQAGIEVPSDSSDEVTWEEWEAAAVQAAEATGTPYAMAIDRTGHRFWGPSLSKCATYITEDGFEVDTEGFRETAQMIIDWHEAGITPLEVWAGGGGGYAAANEFFVNGQLVFYMSGSWQIGQFAEQIGDTFDWEAVPNPCGDCGCTGIPGGAVMVAFDSTEQPEEVTKLVEYLTTEEVLGEFSARSLFIPGHLGLAEKGVDYVSNKEALNVFLGQIPKLMSEAYALQYHPLTFVLNTEIRDRLSQVIVGEITLDEAVERIQQKMDEETGGVTEPPPEPEEEIELRMMWYDDGNEGEVMRDLLDRFEEEHPNIKVVMDTVAYSDLHNVLQAQVEAGTPPDMARVTDMARFAGHYLDMRPYMTDPAGWEENWAEEVLDSFREDKSADGLHGFPTQFTVTGPYINRTLFEQAGIEVPSDSSDEVTWEEWEAAAVQAAEATGTPYAMAIDRTGHRFWGPSLSKCATYITEDGFEVDTEGFRETAQMIIDWHEAGITPLEVWAGGGGGYAAANEFFVNGQLVFYMSGSWQIGQFAEQIGDTFDWEAVPNPCGDCGCTGIPGGAVMVAFDSTEQPEEVTKLVEYLTTEEVLGEFSARSLFIPGHLGLAEKGVDYVSNKEALNVFLGQIPKLMSEAYALQYHPLTFVLNTEIRDRLSQVIVGEITLDEAVERIQQKMDEAVAEQ